MRTAIFTVIASLAVVTLSGFQMQPVKAKLTGRPVNPAAFSFKGLRLYMNPEQAVSAMDLINQELNPDVFEAYRSNPRLSKQIRPCLQEKVMQIKEHLSDVKYNCVVNLHWNSADRWLNQDHRFYITLEFAEALPKSPGVMQLWHIEYSQWGLRTAADAHTILSALVEKYGPPTSGGVEAGLICYANEIGSDGQCGGKNPTSPHLVAKKEMVAYGGGYNVQIDIYDDALQARSKKEEDAVLFPPIKKPVF